MIVQQINKIIETLHQDVLRGTGKKTSELLILSFVVVLLASTVFLIMILMFGSIALLVQSYSSDRIIYQETIFDYVGIKHGIAEFRCHCLWALGFLLFAITPIMSVATQGKFKQNQYKYLPFAVGCVFVVSSMILSAAMDFIPFYSYEYLGQAILFTGGIGISFTFLEDKYRHLSQAFSLIILVGLLIK